VRRTRSSALALVAAAVLGGCGESRKAATSGGTATGPPAAAPSTSTGTTATAPPSAAPSATTPKPSAGGHTATTPANGGTEPARTPLTIEASSRGVSTPAFGVAPFVAIDVSLHSQDGSAHVAHVVGRRLRVGAGHRTDTVKLPGLPAGRSYSVAVDRFKPVTIVSTAEPGP
jgi:hypothetical protein